MKYLLQRNYYIRITCIKDIFHGTRVLEEEEEEEEGGINLSRFYSNFPPPQFFQIAQIARLPIIFVLYRIIITVY